MHSRRSPPWRRRSCSPGRSCMCARPCAMSQRSRSARQPVAREAASAIAHAIERLLATPTIRPVLPLRSVTARGRRISLESRGLACCSDRCCHCGSPPRRRVLGRAVRNSTDGCRVRHESVNRSWSGYRSALLGCCLGFHRACACARGGIRWTSDLLARWAVNADAFFPLHRLRTAHVVAALELGVVHLGARPATHDLPLRVELGPRTRSVDVILYDVRGAPFRLSRARKEHRVVVEEQGPVRVVIRVEGRHAAEP